MNVYIGLDVSLASTAICAVSAQGQIVKETTAASEPEDFIATLKAMPGEVIAVGLEAGPLSQWLYRHLTDAGICTVLMETRQVKGALKAMPIKTDRRDAEGIARLLQMGWYRPVHCKSISAQEMRALLSARKAVQQAAINLELSIRGVLRNFGLKMGRVAKGRFEARVQELTEGNPMLEAAANPILASRRMLRQELAGLEKLLRNHAKEDPVCHTLMTMPGVGPVVALTVMAAIDDPDRFQSSKDIGPWVGLTPRREQSGERDIVGQISRAGDIGLRTALYQAATVMLHRGRKNWLTSWALNVAKRRGKKRATVALARRIGVVLHRMWKDGKYMCRTCDGKSHAQAPAPEFLVPRGLGTNRFAVHSVVAKFCDHLPFYRQSEIWRRDGIEIDRTMLANWAGRIAFHTAPIIDAMIDELKASDRLFADETTVPVLAPRTGKTRKDYLWAVVRDQRGWGGGDPPIVVFQHSRSRSAETAKKIFTGFNGGTLTVDGYAGYDALGDPKKTNQPWGITYCWTHWRRRFVEYSRTTESPICTEMTERIGQLYRIEAEIRGNDPDARRAIRQNLSKPVVEALRPWLEAQLDMLSSSSDLARHIRYGLKRWDGLTRFLDDGRIEMDTNAVENAIRPIPLTRKNALFAGSDDGAVTWARMASLIGTCKLNGINPQAYLEHVLEKILNGHMQESIQDLMPWNFKPDGARHA